MTEPLLCVARASSPEEGEDSFAMRADASGAFLCVADGCGGLGSRRYPHLEQRTGAYLAARLVTRAYAGFARETPRLPFTPEEGERQRRALEEAIGAMLSGFAQRHLPRNSTRIVGSMQRELPATLCGACVMPGAAGWRELCFCWAGDSRGYVLDENGLHQCTRDDLRGGPDAFESLYRDTPLSNVLCAGETARVSMRRMRAPLPGVILLATDGAYSALPTPMEFEFLLVDTLLTAKSWAGWQRRLENRIGKWAQDDATLLLYPCGAEDLVALQRRLAPRRAFLQRNYITPVRRHKGNIAFARERWQSYRQTYDWTEGGRDGAVDWRL